MPAPSRPDRQLIVYCAASVLLALGLAHARGQCVTSEQMALHPAAASAGDRIGFAVSVAHNTVIIGAPEDSDHGLLSGTAYLYQPDPGAPGAWAAQATLFAPDAAAQDLFGYAVSADEDVVVVGAPGDDGSRGAAYVYRRDSNAVAGWSVEAKLVAVDRAAGDNFGAAVAISNGVIVVGAFGDDVLSGSAYVFRRANDPPNGWQQEAKLRASDAAPVDLFAIAVAISDDVIVIGAFEDDDLGASSGAAYVFRRAGAQWTQQAKLLASDGVYRDQFGWSVAIANDVIAVGARNHGGTGAVYVYNADMHAPDGWREHSKLTGASLNAGAVFGQSVAVGRNVIAVGAAADTYGAIQSGAAYVYRFDGCFWVNEAVLIPADGVALDQFGRSMGVYEDVVAVGADQEPRSATAPGAAYLFRGASDCDANNLLDACDILGGASHDIDGDGVLDDCQSDTDGDGVSDAVDVCPNTPSPGGVDATGRPFADFDQDCDVDLTDFGRFTLNFGAQPTE